MTTTAQATGAAIRLARYAAVRKAGILSCPYPPDSTGTRSAARRAWLAEYRRLRPGPPIDYGDKALDLAQTGPVTPDDGSMPARPEPDLFAEVPR